MLLASWMPRRGSGLSAASYDNVTGCEGLEHVRSLLRTVLIEAPDRTKVPYALQWTHEGSSGQALVTMKGRAPVCLRCNDRGHVRRDCVAVRCVVCHQWGHNDVNCQSRPGYSSVVRGQPTFDDAAEVIREDMDVGEGLVTPVAAGMPASEPKPDGQSNASTQPSGPTAVDLADSAVAARVIKSQSSQLVDRGEGSWARSVDDSDIAQVVGAPESPLLTNTSSGSSGDETSGESVAYESPSGSSVSSMVTPMGEAGGLAKGRRRSKRGEGQTGFYSVCIATGEKEINYI